MELEKNKIEIKLDDPDTFGYFNGLVQGSHIRAIEDISLGPNKGIVRYDDGGHELTILTESTKIWAASNV